jgi:hypothetical protein
MDSFPGVLALAALVLVFDLLAMRFGADSRKTIGDDWTRPWSH